MTKDTGREGQTGLPALSRPSGEQASQIQAMFSSIARRYDFLNRLLSLGFDQRWRAIGAREIRPTENGPVLDLACGTGDLAIKTLKERPAIAKLVGADFSREMLLLARKKLIHEGYWGKIHLHQAQAEHLPYKDDVFCGAAIAFGIRNFVDRLTALKEMHRVLKPGGHLVILEFALPSRFPFRAIYRFYLTKLLPAVAGLFSDRRAYQYLSASVTDFPQPGDFAALLQQAGFQEVSFRPLSLGIVTLYQGKG